MNVTEFPLEKSGASLCFWMKARKTCVNANELMKRGKNEGLGAITILLIRLHFMSI
jgi:hypothetical protein